jgi:hypothetical protein
MKVCLVAIPLIAGAMFFSGCLELYPGPGVVSGGSGGAGGSDSSGVSSGIDAVTQAGIDASNAATQQQLDSHP